MKNEESKNQNSEKREDKIFNNRYNQGDGLKDPDEYEYNPGIQVDSTYSSNYLNDIYDYENSVDYQIFLDHVFEMIKNDYEIVKIEINSKEDIFFNLIHIVDENKFEKIKNKFGI